MAFTGEQKAAIRNYLGFSELFHDIDTRLETMMDAIGSQAERVDAKARVVALLAKLAAHEARIEEFVGAGALYLKKAEGEVEFAEGSDALGNMWSLGSTYIQQLSIIFEVKPLRDYFGSEAGSGPIALG